MGINSAINYLVNIIFVPRAFQKMKKLILHCLLLIGSPIFCFGQDTTDEKLPFCYLYFNTGLSMPIGAYGSNAFVNAYPQDPEAPPYHTGFAGLGYTFNISTDISLGKKGWAFSVMADYIEQSFNAAGFLDQNADYIQANSSSGYLDFSSLSSSSDISRVSGNYSYNQYALFGGLSKSFKKPAFITKFRLLFGCMVFNTPAITGTINALNTSTNTNSIPVYCSVDASRQFLFATDMGFGVKGIIHKHLYIFSNLDLIFTGHVEFNMASRLTAPDGTVTESTVGTGTGIFMINFTVGIGYALY